MAKSREVDGEKLARDTRNLRALKIGTPVVLQNQSRRNPTKWDKTGIVVVVWLHKQIVVKVDGSRRLTIRNRRFIRELYPEQMTPVTSSTMTTNNIDSFLDNGLTV